MTIKVTRLHDTLTIAISGEFNFNMRTEFRNGYEKQPPGIKKYILDFSAVTWMDSSALGMLMLLREAVGGNSADITIAGAKSGVLSILKVTQFHKVFKIV